MLAMMAMTIKSFLFGEDLVHWEIDYDATAPQVSLEEVPAGWERRQVGEVYMYFDASNYRPQEFNEVASRFSGLQVFGKCLFISRSETDFPQQCQHAPALPDKFRLVRPENPCAQ